MTQRPPAHELTIRVYYEDTDSGGIVYHASYLRFAERARTEWLRALGLQQEALRAASGLGFVVSTLSINYLAPARLDDALAVTTHLLELGHASMRLRQEVWRGPELLATLQVTVASVNTTGQVARLPADLREKLQNSTSHSA